MAAWCTEGKCSSGWYLKPQLVQLCHNSCSKSAVCLDCMQPVMTMIGVHNAGLSGTQTGTTGRGGSSGGLGAPDRGSRSGGNVNEGLWGIPALAPAPPATGLGALAIVTTQHEQSAVKVRLRWQLCSCWHDCLWLQGSVQVFLHCSLHPPAPSLLPPPTPFPNHAMLKARPWFPS